MTKLFGTDGMRGEAGKFPLDAATVQTVGESLARHLKDKLGRASRIVIGRDTRESGQWLEEALIAGTTAAGAVTESAGIITTPGVAFLACTLPSDAGVVISASHNAYGDNGIKIFDTSGRKLNEDTERLIELDVAAAKSPSDQHVAVAYSKPPAPSHDQKELQARYVDFLVTEIGQGLSLKGMKIVLDCANGAASLLAPQVFGQLGAQVIAINNTPDGRNINLNSGSLHTEGLAQKVKQQKADIGVAFDGDADRSLFIGSKGQLINGDMSLWILAGYLNGRGQLNRQTVVATVMSNVGLELALESKGIRLVRTDVGDKYVLDELIRIGASLGGEQSGHIIFPKLSLAGDGIITTLCLLRAVTEEGKTVDELSEGFESFPQVLVNVEVKHKKPFEEIAAIQKVVREVEQELGSRGRLLLRYSGTEPLARVMIEGDSQDKIEELANKLASVVRESLGS